MTSTYLEPHQVEALMEALQPVREHERRAGFELGADHGAANVFAEITRWAVEPFERNGDASRLDQTKELRAHLRSVFASINARFPSA